MTNYTFAFDLDGTVTRKEILPRIAALLGLEQEVAELTRQTLCGDIPFESSLRRRFAMLGGIPVHTVQAAVDAIPLDPDICAFIAAHRENCAIITGNLDCWVAPLLKQLGCRAFTSRTVIQNGERTLDTVLDKAEAIRILRTEAVSAHRRKTRFSQGKEAESTTQEGATTLVAVGESVNDVPMFMQADIGIAFGGVHPPVPEILRLAHSRADSGQALCALLEDLLHTGRQM